MATTDRAPAGGDQGDAAVLHSSPIALEDELSPTSRSESEGEGEGEEAHPTPAPQTTPDAPGTHAHQTNGLSDDVHMADSPVACPPSVGVSGPAGAGGGSSALLPAGLAGATLQLSSLRSYLHLYPSHRWDDEYNADEGPLESRRTSFEQRTASAFDAADADCPILMNTPDQWWNWQPEEPKPTRATMAAAANARTGATVPASARLEPFKSLEPPSPDHGAAEATHATDEPEADASTHSHEKESDGLTATSFIQCTKCHKWRTVSPALASSSLHPATWSCDQNTWSPAVARCSAGEELYEEGELWSGMPCKFTRLPEHETFYRRLVDLLRSAKHHHHQQQKGDQPPLEELDRFPAIRRKPVDLHLMYESVIKLGGYDKVSASNQWKTIQSCLQIPEQHDSSATLKKLYRKLLGEYEATYWRNPRPSTTSASRKAIPSASSSAGAEALLAAAAHIPERRGGKRSAPTSAAKMSWRGGDEGDEENGDGDGDVGQSGGARKKQRRAAAFGVDELEAELYDQDDQPHAYQSMSDIDAVSPTQYDRQGRSLPAHTARIRGGGDSADECGYVGADVFGGASASAPAPSVHALEAAIRTLHATLDTRCRQMERRAEERFTRLEATLTRALADGLASIRSEVLAQARKQNGQWKEHERKQELMARGMNMLLADKVKMGLAKGGPSSLPPSSAASAQRRSLMSSPTMTAPAASASSRSTSLKPSTSHRYDGSDTVAAGVSSSVAMDESKEEGDSSGEAAHTFSVTTFVPSATLIAPAAPPYPRSLAWVRQRWTMVDAVCFDVDSTVSAEEGIDVLAEYLGKGPEVKALTAQAMNGTVLFQDALQARLSVMRPSALQVSECVARHPPTFTPGFLDFIAWLRSDALKKGGLPIYLISGGFRLLIEPLRLALGLPEESVFANRFQFASADGAYEGFDAREFTSRSGGKARALEHIGARDGRQCLAMIGDGMTDVEACPPAQLMIGFGGVTTRQPVKEKAHYFITDWKEIPALFKEPVKRESAPSPLATMSAAAS